MSDITTTSLAVVADGRVSSVKFENYELVKSELERRLGTYVNCVYSVDNFETAEKNREELKQVKKLFEDKKKEIDAAYKAPYEDVICKLDELIEMIKEPFKAADTFIKDNEKEKKKKDIFEYAVKKSAVLGEFADKIISSPAFDNPKWLNASVRTKQWQSEVDEKIKQAQDDLQTIQTVAGGNTKPLMAHYFETLSMASVNDFAESLKDEIDASAEIAAVSDSGPIGYKVIRINATERQMLRIISELDLMGVDYEELEDGMPKQMTELTEPSFDSFVAFDLEHSGTFGADYGDGDSEIIEIGAVKVVNGTVTEKFSELCNPGRRITPMVAKLTHISDAMVADKPSVSEVIKAFKDFVGDLPLVGHNIKSCDIPHITRAAKRAGIAFDNSFFDTYVLSKKLMKKYGWENVKLTTLSDYFGIEQTDAHRAWCDAEANAGVYLKLKEIE